MAITQARSFIRTIHGDGVSSVYVVDLTEEIEALHVLPRTPSDIIFVACTTTQTIQSAAVVGLTAVITFNGIVAANDYGNLSFQLLF